MAGGLSCFQILFGNNPNTNDITNNNNQPIIPPSTCIYHKPPPGVTPKDYSDNTSVFGKILNGDLPSGPYHETSELYSFRDKSPHAKLHALVIPKRYIQNVYSLTPTKEDVALIQDMRQLGLDLLEEQQPRALEEEDYILCFHIPPFNSVDHLHLHVLAPASEMGFVYRYGKYNSGTRWCIGDLEVIERLEGGMVAVPYARPF
eukprot:CAMPEP_0201619262 /NCGR_PEP_ID=MMETSP0492-20130828/41162_1 /ASSEMBLY_ACC=CAM_ASM_000837 /TAXON_ID=420259 /ORGANISM="Thalassiosira gravida, Strain GMp14c1" /LENGTH=202 /DNA_ID=CAMNT_0048088095 /DNA_START=72 /DNA_END=680 /DNA_ORIENTATION=+